MYVKIVHCQCEVWKWLEFHCRIWLTGTIYVQVEDSAFCTTIKVGGANCSQSSMAPPRRHNPRVFVASSPAAHRDKQWGLNPDLVRSCETLRAFETKTDEGTIDCCLLVMFPCLQSSDAVILMYTLPPFGFLFLFLHVLITCTYKVFNQTFLEACASLLLMCRIRFPRSAPSNLP